VVSYFRVMTRREWVCGSDRCRFASRVASLFGGILSDYSFTEDGIDRSIAVGVGVGSRRCVCGRKGSRSRVEEPRGGFVVRALGEIGDGGGGGGAGDAGDERGVVGVGGGRDARTESV